MFWVVMLCWVNGSQCSEGVCDLCCKGQAVQEEDYLICEYSGTVNLQMPGTICPVTQHHITEDLKPATVDVFRDGRRMNMI